MTEALRKSGTEKGRALAAQKLTLNQDFDLMSVKAMARANKGGKALTPEETAAFEEATTKLDAATKRVAELEAKLKNQTAERAIRQHKAANRDVTAEARKRGFTDLLNEAKALLDAGCY
jgi:t-SNARE complex subunit (syntaxin)